ncbi:MAG: hypothetical protein ACO1RA_15590 [Planctomycetaceae bacterium]
MEHLPITFGDLKELETNRRQNSYHTICKYFFRQLFVCVSGFLILTASRQVVIAQDFPTVNGGKPTTNTHWKSEGETALLKVICPNGIDKIALRPGKGKWPKEVRLQLQLQGLEHLTLRTDKHDLCFSVSSTAPHDSTCVLVVDGKEQALRSDHPLFAKVKLHGKKNSIPLNDGYFEVIIPTALLQANPPQIAIEWIDFYR